MCVTIGDCFRRVVYGDNGNGNGGRILQKSIANGVGKYVFAIKILVRYVGNGAAVGSCSTVWWIAYGYHS